MVGLFLIALIGWGSYAVTQLPIDAVPDITNNQVLVITSSPSLGAPDVERFITVPVEQATANIPGLIEQRSFSRFGLSIVTIVFNDETDVYWARQQVSERLVQVQQQIPAGMGVPSLGPVTTGLGEVFQYVVKAKPGYEGKYNLTELRSIQDWIVRRQLLGTPGVADVSSFGGELKQYEVAVNPEKLKSFQLTIAEVFKALQDNNQNAGGAYIEKGPAVLFIRSEGLVSNLDDIGNIPVKHLPGGVPVLVRDVATVRQGHAIRYGATVYNNQGEVAGAVVMMLKGGNSSRVIKNIKAKIAEIEKTLPEGVSIEPFLDRTKMVNNAIDTVKQNLLEGALIVIFVLVLFLGNLRAGIIVASVIPLSMLFAVILMNLFGVSGNLMSLGAVDFGLLVDGAVIIVEAVMHKLRHSPAFSNAFRLTQQQMNAEVEQSSEKMMNSAVFGQVIILIVYIPILTLQGIEGKMFRPMAETVSFAILGAFLLSLTYVPMMSALFLSKNIQHKDNFADRIMKQLQNWYRPLLKRSLRVPVLIVTSAFLLCGVAVYILTRLGGEFIPQLEEGDFAVDTRLLSGSSLSNTVRTTQQTAGLLLQRFPEVEKVVTKIGSGEIPTDPMPLDAADMMVILKPKKEWKSAQSFPELANKMSEALQAVPGVTTGFQFPVQMRFNELMTGARQDVVCKIFGDDLDTLTAYAGHLSNIIQRIKGARDLYVETVTGVSQMVIHYNRAAIAQYGANIADINNTIQSAYAGATAGLVFENDRRYDLVIRMNDEQKREVSEIGNLPVGLPNGQQVPLYLLANVQLQNGPYQIQREFARRRITVGFNVRGRDVQSIVHELQQKVRTQVKLPPGYTITYGGQYENLQHATARLSIAVPVALLLIFLLLYFAFHQVKYALLIFSAIPLAAIGGVVALWLRGMPFSISAGVGFIALFGVAVLNGIVLISEMNRLKQEGLTDIKEVIARATDTRLRPVLMTASVASLGFLPMALSNGAGAEVQRPLATVVIGGLMTATLLTLFVLPSLYLLFELTFRKMKPKHIATTVLLLLCCLPGLRAQPVKKMHLQEALQMAAQQNLRLSASRLQEEYYGILKTSAVDPPRTQLNAELGNINSANTDTRFSVTQGFSFPAVYRTQKTVLEDEWKSAQLQTALQKTTLIKYVKQAYLQLQYLEAKQHLLTSADSLYAKYRAIAQLRYTKGETSLLEKTMLDNEASQIALQLQLIQSDKRNAQALLQVLLQTTDAIEAADTLAQTAVLPDTAVLQQHPYLQYYRQQQQLAAHETSAEKAKMLPDILLGYSNQSIIGWQQNKAGTDLYYDGSRRFSTVQLGVGIPLFNKAQKTKIRAAQKKEQVAGLETSIAQQQLALQLQQGLSEYDKYLQAVAYYRNTALPNSRTIRETAGLQYANGDINYIEWTALVKNAITLESGYVDALKELNSRKIDLEFLTAQEQVN